MTLQWHINKDDPRPLGRGRSLRLPCQVLRRLLRLLHRRYPFLVVVLHSSCLPTQRQVPATTIFWFVFLGLSVLSLVDPFPLFFLLGIIIGLFPQGLFDYYLFDCVFGGLWV